MVNIFSKAVNFIARRHFFVHIFLVVVALVVGILLYFQQGASTQTALAAQMLHRQQVISRSGALSIQQFLTDFGKSESLFAGSTYIVKPDKVNTANEMKLFVSAWNDPSIGSISFINSKGITAYNYNNGGANNYIGSDLSARDYFKWSETASLGQYYIGSPVIAKTGISAGHYVIPVVSPVFDSKGKFEGALLSGVRIDNMIPKFSDPLKISDNTMVFLLDHNGNFVFSPLPKLTGTNFVNLFDGVPFPGKDQLLSNFKSEFANPDLEGKFDIVIPNIASHNELTRFLMTYTVANLGPGNDWSLIVLTPASDAYLFTGPFYKDQIVFLIYVIVVILTFSIVGLTSHRVRERTLGH